MGEWVYVCVLGLEVFFQEFIPRLARTVYTLKKTLHTHNHIHIRARTRKRREWERLRDTKTSFVYSILFFIFSFLVFSSPVSVSNELHIDEVHYTYLQCVYLTLATRIYAAVLSTWWTLYSFSPVEDRLSSFHRFFPLCSSFSVLSVCCWVAFAAADAACDYNIIEFKEFIFIRSCFGNEWDKITRRCNAKHVFAWNSFVSWSKLNIGSLEKFMIVYADARDLW